MKKVIIVVFLFSFGLGVLFSGTINIIQPDGGESLIKGSSYLIKWNAVNTTHDFKITLWRDGVSVGIIKSNIAAGTGERNYNWTVGNFENGTTAEFGTGYKIKVKEKTVDVSDISMDSFGIFKFKIVKKPKKIYILNITDPLNDEVLTYGKKKIIKWNSIGLTGRTVEISIIQYGLPNVKYIVGKNIPLDQKEVEWTVGQIGTGKMYNHAMGTTTGYQLRFVTDDGGSSYWRMGNTFKIYKKEPRAVLR